MVQRRVMHYLPKNSNLAIYAFLTAVALLVGVCTQWPALSSPYVIIEDDVAQHTYWMAKYHDPELFNDDIYVQYIDFMLPAGFKAVYYVGTFLTDPVTLGNVLSLILFALSAVLFFKLGSAMQGVYAGLTLSLLFMCFPSHILSFAGGLGRAFAYPLLAAFLYYLLRLNLRACIVLLVLQIFFYPGVFFISFLALVMVLIGERKFWSKGTFPALFIPLAIFGAYMLYKSLIKPAFLGNLTDIDVILANPDHPVYGRSQNVPPQSLWVVTRDLLMSHKLFIIGSFLFVLAALSDLKERKAEALRKYLVILSLFVASVVMYQVSNAVLLKLHLPIKYVRYSFPLIGLMVIATGAGFAFSRITSLRLRMIFLGAIGLAVFFMYPPLSLFIHQSQAPGVHYVRRDMPDIDQQAYEELYEYIAMLPKDAVIAANPRLSDYISVFSQRRTFLKYEMSYPWFDKYAQTVEQRTRDFYRAYYSASRDEVHDFCVRHDVDYMVVTRDDFSKEAKFALEDIGEKDIIYRTEDEKIAVFICPR